jgi:hypothetical protein
MSQVKVNEMLRLTCNRATKVPTYNNMPLEKLVTKKMENYLSRELY